MPATFRTALLLSLLSAGGCSVEPWVKPYERQYLADPLMRFERDPAASSYTKHVYQAREGSRGSGVASCGLRARREAKPSTCLAS